MGGSFMIVSYIVDGKYKIWVDGKMYRWDGMGGMGGDGFG